MTALRSGTFADPVRRAAAIAGRRASAIRGQRPSGAVPYGYRAPGYRGPLVVHEPEAEVVRRIFREALNGKSFARIAADLDVEGIRPRRGARWSRSGISMLMRNRIYIGRVRYGDIDVLGVHEPIVAPAIFYRVQQLVQARNKRHGHRPSTELPQVRRKQKPHQRARVLTPFERLRELARKEGRIA